MRCGVSGLKEGFIMFLGNIEGIDLRLSGDKYAQTK